MQKGLAIAGETNHIMAHPSASWKLKAISTPLPGSCHTMSVSVAPVLVGMSPRKVGEITGGALALLLLESILLLDRCLQEESFGLVFGFNNDFGIFVAIFVLYYTQARTH